MVTSGVSGERVRWWARLAGDLPHTLQVAIPAVQAGVALMDCIPPHTFTT